jgi:AraC-like DNA-binding protein
VSGRAAELICSEKLGEGIRVLGDVARDPKIVIETKEDFLRFLSAIAPHVDMAESFSQDACRLDERRFPSCVRRHAPNDLPVGEAVDRADFVYEPRFFVECGPQTQIGQARRVTSSLPKWRFMRVVQYIDANLAEPIKLADLAAVAGLSRMYFASQFRMATGLRPHIFLLKRRIQRAQEQMIATTDSLVEIALSVGFQSQAHFTTTFRKLVGQTPYRWRRERHISA